MKTDYNELVRLTFGSHLYGTSTPASDQDFKSIYIPEGKDILLDRVKRSFNYNTKLLRERAVDGIIAKNSAEDVDMEVLTLAHFFHMLEEGDPMALDMLFAPPSMVLKNSRLWNEIQENSDKLVSTNISRSLGYCYSQAAKYGIKGSRMSECRALREFFLEETNKKANAKVKDFDDQIRTIIKDYKKTEIVMIEQGNGTNLEHLECCSKKISYNVTVKEAFAILDNLFQKFGERTKMAEKNEGVDWKGLSHAVRVGNQVLELLETGTITFPRPEAELLLKIKTGQMPYKDVAEIIETNVDLTESYVKKSVLPPKVNIEWMEEFVCRVYGCAVLEMQL